MPAFLFVTFRRNIASLEKELQAAAIRVLSSGQVILGPEVAALEEEIARYCGAGYGVGCSSGTDALLLALPALGIGPGDEVILPPFTFFATVGAVCRLGARPVFADIDPVTYNIDPLQVENKITDAHPGHHGRCTSSASAPTWNRSGASPSRHNLPIIEDAAQAIGAEYQGKRTGTLGGIALLQLLPVEEPRRLRRRRHGASPTIPTGPRHMACLRVHGMEPKYHHKYIGWNARLDALQAALLRVKLPHLDRWTAAPPGGRRPLRRPDRASTISATSSSGRRCSRTAGTSSTSTSSASPAASATPWCAI